jgi:FAD/FMN-containing dehydrogenase
MNEMPQARRPDAALLERLKAIVGPKGWAEAAEDLAPHLTDWRRRYRGATPLLLKPASAAEVAAIVGLCAEARVPIVPQGGNTGLCGGATPGAAGDEILLSLARLNRIRHIDPAGGTVTVEAGCILRQVQEAAAAADRLLPLSLAAEGSCQIGGNLATNAGGIAVLRYGNARDLVLGLEAVLPDGRIWDGLRSLRKDNTGYDLKQLFIGAEGTLGIITAAVLRLFPAIRERVTAFAAPRDLTAAVELLARCRAAGNDSLTSFELLPRAGIDLALRHIPGAADPLPDAGADGLLIEFGATAAGTGLRAAVEAALAAAQEDGLIADATIAGSEEQARKLWFLREAIVELQKHAGASIKHDVAVAVARVPEFIAEAGALSRRLLPGVRVIAFGHLGDGNIHFNLYQPEGMEADAFLAREEPLSAAIHDLAASLGGSFSAEHGIGRLRRPELRRYKSEVDLDLMRRLKQALDPQGIMNPGKVL